MCCPQCDSDYGAFDMSKNKSGGIFEIRTGVFAFGTIGERALAVVEKAKGGGGWAGVRGVKPLITQQAKQGNPPQAAIDKLAELTAA
jgi:hypothetical protein